MGDRSNKYDNDATDNDFFSVKTNSDTNVNSNTIDDDWDFVNSLFDDIDSGKPKTTTKATDKNKSSSNNVNNDNNDAVKSDFNNLINNILDDMVKDKPSSSSSSSSSSSDKKSNSDKAIKDFLKDLSNDTGSSKKKGDLNGGQSKAPMNNIPDDDDLDFDKLFGDLDELDTIFSDSSSNSKSKSTKKVTTTNSETTKTDSKVPSMEDYPTFEAYLDALGIPYPLILILLIIILIYFSII